MSLFSALVIRVASGLWRGWILRAGAVMLGPTADPRPVYTRHLRLYSGLRIQRIPRAYYWIAGIGERL